MRWMRANAVINECNLACHLTLSTIRERRGETFDPLGRTEKRWNVAGWRFVAPVDGGIVGDGYVWDFDNSNRKGKAWLSPDEGYGSGSPVGIMEHLSV